MRWNRILTGLVLAGASLVLSGCLVVPHGHGSRGHTHVETRPGPPPHAPAHGYRHKHRRGPELVYDGRLGVNTVELPSVDDIGKLSAGDFLFV